MEEEVLGLRNPDKHTRVGTVYDIRIVMDIGEEINDGKELKKILVILVVTSIFLVTYMSSILHGFQLLATSY